MERRWRFWGFRNEAWRPRYVRGDDRTAALEIGMAAFEDGASCDVDACAGSAATCLDDLLAIADGHEVSTVEALRTTSSLSVEARRILEASLAERAGDPVGARALLTELWETTPLSSVGARLADYALWAGEFELAASFAEAAGRLEFADIFRGLDEAVRVLTRRMPRNRPCLCGSGRKYKFCCLRNGAIIGGHRTLATLVHVKMMVSGPTRLRGVPRDHFIVEHTRISDTAARRAPLLPDAERAIFDAVLTEPIRLWELVEICDGTSVLRSGERRVKVRSISGTPGDWGLARVLPEQNISFGTVEDVDSAHALKVNASLPPDAGPAQLMAALDNLRENDAGELGQERSR